MNGNSKLDVRVEQFAQRAVERYQLPEVAVQLLALSREPGCSPRAVSTCIDSDPGLAAKILRVLNGSLFELDHRVIGINHAVSLLGISRIQHLAFGLCVPRKLFDDLKPSFLQRYWRHSLTKAVAAREFSLLLWQLPGDEPFACGLLQGIGQLALAQDLGPSYCDFVERVHSSRAPLTQMESKSLGFHHRLLSRRLLEHWSFPERIVSSVAWTPHEAEPVQPDRESLLMTLELAGLLADALADQRADAAEELATRFPSKFYSSPADLIELAERIQEKVGHLALALSVASPPYGDYREILTSAAERIFPESVTWSDDPESEWSGAESGGVALRDLARPATANHATRAPRTCSLDADLVVNPRVVEPLAAALAECCQNRTPLSLLLIEIQGCDALLGEAGDKTQALLRSRLAALRSALDPTVPWVPLGEPGRETLIGVLLPAHDRQQAVATARQLLAAFCHVSPQTEGWGLVPCLGLATMGIPRKSARPAELIEAAARCLAATRTQILGGLKSIDVF